MEGRIICEAVEVDETATESALAAFASWRRARSSRKRVMRKYSCAESNSRAAFEAAGAASALTVDSLPLPLSLPTWV